VNIKLKPAAHAHLAQAPSSGVFCPTNVLQGAAHMSKNASCNLLLMRTCVDTPYPDERHRQLL
jgi:hypothetical protein